MGCGGSEEGADAEEFVVIQDDNEDITKLPRRRITLNIDPVDPELGETFQIHVWSFHTVVMVMCAVQEHMDSYHRLQGQLPALWEPRLRYQGRAMTGNKGRTLDELGVQDTATMQVEVIGSQKGLALSRSPAPRRKENLGGGALWDAPAWERPTYGIEKKTRKP
eukprot:TRINITY_DN34727_c0_g1_i1.p1 TRINITY_DN34727_c0_g1~~TRINITY_DN34727_c0_g1_i1.p1  ORF type:complete len:164 (+),score=26.95 TRINITY_DN34727_c0_g1_i1:163-654(+)